MEFFKRKSKLWVEKLLKTVQPLMRKMQQAMTHARLWIDQQAKPRIQEAIRQFKALPKQWQQAFYGVFFFGFFLSLFLVTVVFSRSSPSKLMLNAQGKTDRIFPVTVATVEKNDIRKEFSTYAFLQPVKEVTIRPSTQVTVNQVKIGLGDQVEKGQALAALGSELQILRTKLDQHNAKLKEIDFSVTMALAKKDFLSKNEFKQKELEHQSQKIRSKMSDLENESSLRAPISGTIAEISLKNGDFIDNSQNYFIKIVDTSAHKIELFIPQNIATQLKKDDTALLRRQDTSEIDVREQTVKSTDSIEEIDAKIRAIAPFVDPKTGSVFVELFIDVLHPNWITGMFVEVILTTNHVKEALVIPNDSVIFENGKTYVFKVAEPDSPTPDRSLASKTTATIDRALKMPVKLGIVNSTHTAVLEGLEEFDQIVVQGQSSLSDQAKIEIIQ